MPRKLPGTDGNKPKKPKQKYSRWLLTIDTRKKPGTYPGGEMGLKRNYELVSKLFKPPLLKRFIYFTPKGHTFEANMIETSETHAIE